MNIRRLGILFIVLISICNTVHSQSYTQIVNELQGMLKEYDVYISDRVANGYRSSSTSSASVTYNPPMLTVQITRSSNSYNSNSFTIRAQFDVLKSRFVKGDQFKWNGYWSEGSEKSGLTVISESGVTIQYLNTGKKELTEQLYFSGNDIVTRRINNALLQLQSLSKENKVEKSAPHMFDDAELVIDSITFTDPDGDNKLAPGETGCILVSVSNKNNNDATNIDCIINEDGSSESFVYENYHSLNLLRGSQSHIISIPIKASNDIDNSSYKFNISVKYKGKLLKNSSIDINTYNKQKQVKQPQKVQTASGSTTQPKYRTIKMKKMSGNTYQLSCKVNGLPMNFILDTGASSVTLSKKYAQFMMKNGYLTKNDIKNKQTYQTADGNLSVGTIVTIKKIEIGGIPLYNVEAAIINSNDAPLLLGQSALSKLGKIQIDFNTSVLTIIK